MNVKPKKYLGQHFLVDKNIANKIVDSLLLENSNSLVEIGPGKGILTELILRKGINNYYLIDIDSESIEYLRNEFSQLGDWIIEDDFLKSDILNKIQKPVALIGNLPYNISSQIIFKLLKNRDVVTEMVCMIQKEVADRFVAGYNTKTYGILSVLLQAFYKIEYLFTVSEKVFYPKPKVKSAVIRLTRKKQYTLDCNEDMFFQVVKTSFGKRRKTLRNSLKEMLSGIDSSAELFSRRPEQLSVNDFIHLTNFIDKDQTG